MEKKTRKDLAELIRKARRKKRRLVDGFDAAKRKRRDNGWFGAILALLVLAVALAVAARLLEPRDWARWLLVASVVLMLIVYGATICFGVAPAWRARRAAALFAREPATLANAVVRSTLIVDSWLLAELAKFAASDLDEMALALEASGRTLTARVHLLIGAIEKIGIFPGILALLVVVVQLPRETPAWISAFMFAMPVLYVLALMVTASTIDVSHYASVVRLALARKRGLPDCRNQASPLSGTRS